MFICGKLPIYIIERLFFSLVKGSISFYRRIIYKGILKEDFEIPVEPEFDGCQIRSKKSF